jgi:nitrogen fixation NifU-like protein
MTIPEPQLDDLYREIVLDHYKNPRGKEPVTHPDASNEGVNPVCGDEVKIALRLNGANVDQIEVQGRGCSISVASGSMMAEHLKGKSLEEVLKIFSAFKARLHDRQVDGGVDVGDLEALDGVKKFPIRIKCALLPWVTLEDAIRALEDGKSRPDSVTSTENE